MWRALALGLVLSGCLPAKNGKRDGTIVGNPGDAAARVAPIDGIEIYEAFAVIDEVTFIACNGDEEPVLFRNLELDMLEPEESLIPMSPGEWCAVEVHFFEPVFIEGQVEGGGIVALELDLDMLLLESSEFELNRDTFYLLEFAQPGWLTPEEVPVPAGSELFIEPGHMLYDDIIERPRLKSALFRDTDGDGTASARERQDHQLAGGIDREPFEPEEGDPTGKSSVPNETGCRQSSGKSSLGTSVFLLLFLGFRSRKRKRT